jgi:hypothetical protein
MKEGISIVSSFGNDVLLKSNGELISEQPGGPIVFLEEAIRRSSVPYALFYGNTIDVHVLITDDGEFGKIPQRPNPQKLPIDQLSDWAVISTLLNEWELSSLSNFSGKAFVDVQGYVREGSDFGKKRLWEEATTFADSIFCIKGTSEEIKYLPESVRNAQKNKLLIATDGSRGLDIFYQGEGFFIPAIKINKPKDTLGAGDTFFGYFVASMYTGIQPLQAAEIAAQKTGEFLSQKR